MNSLALNRKSIPIEYRGIFPIYYAPRSSLVVITCSKKSPERVQSAAEYSPIISKHRTQINLSSPKKAEIRNG